MYKDKLDGVISEADYQLFRISLTEEEQQASELIESVCVQIDACRKRIENAAGQRALLEQYTHFEQLDRTITDEFIDYIEIGMTDEQSVREIHIQWKI